MTKLLGSLGLLLSLIGCAHNQASRGPASAAQPTSQEVITALKGLDGNVLKSQILNYDNQFTPLRPEAMKKLSNQNAPEWTPRTADIEKYREYMIFFRAAVKKLSGEELKQIIINNSELFLPFAGHSSSNSGDELLVHYFDMARTSKALGIKDLCFSYINFELPKDTDRKEPTTYSVRVAYDSKEGRLEPYGNLELSRTNDNDVLSLKLISTNLEIGDFEFSSRRDLNNSLDGHFRNLIKKDFYKVPVSITGKMPRGAYPVRTLDDLDWQQKKWNDCGK